MWLVYLNPLASLRVLSVCFIMTRGELKKFCKVSFPATFETEAANDPEAWDLLLSQATNDLCRATDCLWLSVTAPINQGQYKYNCLPLYKIRGVQIRIPQPDNTFVTSNLAIKQHDWLPYYFSGSDTNPKQGIPSVCAVNGTKQIEVYPVPNFTYSSGLILTGYATPGEFWSSDSDECPLPEWSHIAVAYGAMISRAITVPFPPQQLQILMSRYKEMRGRLEVEAATNTRAKAIQKGDGNIVLGSSSYSPLNL